MSTAVATEREESAAAVAAAPSSARAPRPAPAPVEASFDRATSERIRVAEAAARTLESLSETRAWMGLDPAIAEHLLAHAGRLRAHLETLQDDRAVRASEATRLMLRRIQRRLEVVTDDLSPAGTGSAAAGASLFLGDFTEAEPDDRDAIEAPSATPARERPSERAAPARPATRAERLAKLKENRRLTFYVLGCIVLVLASAAWRAFATLESRPVSPRTPTSRLVPQEHVADLRLFMPVIATASNPSGITVVVSKEWLLRPERVRHENAAAAHVFLANRNVDRMVITWEDGMLVAAFDKNGAQWFTNGVPPKPEPEAQ